jgi:homoaconitase/3-isopropylmalate dehydratase large subunit
MGQTITEKIFSDHVGHAVHAGEIIKCKIDMVIGNDITTPISIKAFEESGATSNICTYKSRKLSKTEPGAAGAFVLARIYEAA